jgi:predicted aconitase with swiveling domain
MIVKNVETVLVVTSFIGKVPLVDKHERDPFTVIDTGDYVKVNADEGIVVIIKHKIRTATSARQKLLGEEEH